MGLFVHKTTFRKICKNTHTQKNAKPSTIFNILGTKLILLVDLLDPIFKTVFPKHFGFVFYLKLLDV